MGKRRFTYALGLAMLWLGASSYGNFSPNVPDEEISGARASDSSNQTFVAENISFGGTIRSVRFIGTYFPLSAVPDPSFERLELTIYANDGVDADPKTGLPGGYPGTQIDSSALVGRRTPSLVHIQPNGITPNYYVYEMNLSNPITLGGGDYWLAIRNVEPQAGGLWYWGMNPTETPVGVATQVLVTSSNDGSTWIPSLQNASLALSRRSLLLWSSTPGNWVPSGMITNPEFIQGLASWNTTGDVVNVDGEVLLTDMASISQSIDTPASSFELRVSLSSPDRAGDVTIRINGQSAATIDADELSDSPTEFVITINDPALMGLMGTELSIEQSGSGETTLTSAFSPLYAVTGNGVGARASAEYETFDDESVTDSEEVIESLIAVANAEVEDGGAAVALAAARAAALFGGAEAGASVEVRGVDPVGSGVVGSKVAEAFGSAVGVSEIESPNPGEPVPLDYAVALDGFIDLLGYPTGWIRIEALLETSRVQMQLLEPVNFADREPPEAYFIRRPDAGPSGVKVFFNGPHFEVLGAVTVTDIPGGARATLNYLENIESVVHVQPGDKLKVSYQVWTKGAADTVEDGVITDFLNTVTGGISTSDSSITITQLDNIDETSVVASVLPTSRSVQVGEIATAFVTMINSGGVTAENCSISAANPDFDFRFQQTDSLTNALAGNQGFGVDIPAGAAQTFIISIEPRGDISPQSVPLSFDCDNSLPATSIVGVNDLALTADFLGVPDIVALSATIDGDGILKSNGSGVFSVATVNVGVGDDITATADTGDASLPIQLSICETNPTTGVCLADPVDAAVGVTTNIADGGTPTFGVFAATSGDINLDPASNRVFVRFSDANQTLRGSTSVAVQTQ